MGAVEYDHVQLADALLTDLQRSATCITCLDSQSQEYCRLGLTFCPILSQPTKPERRDTSRG